jgi:hypothetical protein
MTSKEKTDKLIWGQDLKKAADAMDEPQYTPRDEPFEIVDGKRDIVPFSLLANDKKELFTIHKPVRDITLEELYTNAQKALSNITLEDYEHYKRETADLPNSFFLHIGNERSGFASYLFAIAQTTGYVALAILKNPYAKGTPITYAWKISGEFFKLCMAITDKIYADKEKRQRPALPKLPKRPERYIAPNNTLINKMSTEPLINAGAVDITVSQEKEITTYAMILDAENEQAAPYNLPNFERIVSTAIGSIYIQAKKDGYERVIVTPASIYKAMPGGGDRVTPKAAKLIDKAVEKMRGRKVIIDATSELAAYKKIRSDEKFLIDDFMIHAKRGVYICRNRKETVGWEIYTKPALFEYAEKSGELVNVPAKVMQTPAMQGAKQISINETRRELWDYLVRRIVVIKRAYDKAKDESRYKRNEGKTIEQIMTKHGKSPVIIYQTAFNAVNITTSNRAVLKENRDFCKWLLTYWKKLEFICDFREVKQGNTCKGIKVLFD